MEINYSDKELENFTSKKSTPQDKTQTPKKINYTPPRPPAPSRQAVSFQHSIPQQKPQKEIAPPQNIPNIAPPQQNITSQTSSSKPKFSYPKLELNFKKPAVIGILAAAVIFIFILIVSRIFLGGGTYSILEKFLLFDKYPPEVHSNAELYIKFKNLPPLLKSLGTNNWLSNLSAFVSQPPVPLPPNSINSPDDFFIENPPTSSFDEKETFTNPKNVEDFPTSANESIQENFTPPFFEPQTPPIANLNNIEIKLSIISDQKTTPDRLNIEKLKSSINFNLNFDPFRISGAFNVLFDNNSNALYLKINNLSPLEILPNNLANFLNQWIKIDFNDVLQSLPPEYQEYQNEFLKSFEENLQKNKELENEIIRFIKGKKVQNLVAIRSVKSEKINNAEAYHYTLSLKKDFLKDLLNIFSKAVATGLSQGTYVGLLLSDFDLNEIFKGKEFNAILDKITQIPFEIWFGKNDSLIYRFSLDLGKIGTIMAGSDIIEGYFNIDYSGYGMDFELKPPAEYKNIGEILVTLGFIYDPLTRARNAKRIADLQALKSALSLYYKDHKKDPISPSMTKIEPGHILEKALVPKYIFSLPQDPLYPQFYYGYKSDGKSYELTAKLEAPKDKSLCDPAITSACIYKIKVP